MKLAEQIQIDYSKQLYEMCHNSKNLYNLALFYCNRNYEILEEHLSWIDLTFMLKGREPFNLLPYGVSKEVLRDLSKIWKSYFNSLKDWRRNYKKYKGKPRPPRYKEKDGEYVVKFTYNMCRIKEGILYFQKRGRKKEDPYWIEPIKTRFKGTWRESWKEKDKNTLTLNNERIELKEIRIIPLGIKYKVEIVYEKSEQDLQLNRENILSIDIGINNIVASVGNNGFKAFVIKGGAIKSINHYYNKNLAYYRRIESLKGNFKDTKRIKKLHLTRNNKIKLYFHRITKQIIEYCRERDIGTIIIGYNEGWKQKVKIGKVNTQKFVQIPFFKLINQLKYKGKLIGLDVQTITEEYTSQECCKCGLIDKTNRKTRGLYICKMCGNKMNADINASYNIMKKAFPNTISVEGIKAHQSVPCVFTENLYDSHKLQNPQTG